MKRFALALLALALTGPLFAADGPGQRPPAEARQGIVGRYLLMDPNGRAVSNEDFRGQFQLVTFGYTYCPDVCPTTLAEMAAVMKALGARAERLQPIFITVDPERDSGPVLKTYTEFFHPRLLGLTGSPALVRRAADNFKVRYQKVREPGQPAERYAMDHSAGIYLLGPDGSFIRKFAYATSPEAMAAALGEAMAGR